MIDYLNGDFLPPGTKKQTAIQKKEHRYTDPATGVEEYEKNALL